MSYEDGVWRIVWFLKMTLVLVVVIVGLVLGSVFDCFFSFVGSLIVSRREESFLFRCEDLFSVFRVIFGMGRWFWVRVIRGCGIGSSGDRLDYVERSVWYGWVGWKVVRRCDSFNFFGGVRMDFSF